MPTSFTQESKPSVSFTREPKPGLDATQAATWDDMTNTWAAETATWDNASILAPATPYTKEPKP